MRKPAIFIILAIFFFISPLSRAERKPHVSQLKRPIFGIIVPLIEESLLLQKNIDHKKKFTIEGITYYVGTIRNKNVVFVNCGLGKVNSAIVATRLIRDFHPDLILMSGSAGSINVRLKMFDVIVGKEVVNVDLGTLTKNGVQFKFSQYLYNPQSHTMLPIIFKLSEQLVKRISQLNNDHSIKVLFGNIATSDRLPNQPPQVRLLRDDHFDVVEMEGASLMQACWLFNTQCVVIRGVSNNMAEPITTKNTRLAADNAAQALIDVIANF